jgi:hypothetical protein
VKNKASNLSSQFKQEKESALRRHLQDDLQLSANDVNAIMTNFDANPRNMNALHQKAKNLKQVSSEKVRLNERLRKAREENALNLKFRVDVKTMNNVKKLNAQINQAYIGKGKKNLSRRALNKNINISSELNAAKSMNDIQKLKNKLNGILKGKKNQDLKKIEEVTKNLNQENRNRFLQKFKNQNIELNTVLENIQKFKNSKTKEVHEKQKQELYTYLNETLNLNVKDRDTIMFEFNDTKNLNGMKRKANALKKTRASEKIVADRKKLEELLKPMNLTEENKATILKKFDNAPGNLESFEANAKSMIEQRKNEKRSKERDELVTYMNNLGLSSQNKNMIVGFFNQSPNKTLESSKNNATTTKKTRDQEKLENALKNLSNISEKNKNTLRTNLKSGKTLNVVLNSAKRMNVNAKTSKSVKQSIVNYVLSKNLGDDGNKLIKNFESGLLTANKVKEEANKKKVSMNAQIVSNKKNKLRTFMKNTLLTNQEKNKYIDRVKLNTDLGDLEKDIQRIDANLKNKRNTFARKQTELSAFLDGLTNLTSNQKQKFVSEIKNATADIEGLKRRAKKIDDAKKAGKKVTEERVRTKNDNNFNAGKAMNDMNRMAKRQSVLNEISKYDNKRITKFKGRAGNPFRTAKQYNQIANNVKKMVEVVKTENREALKKLLKTTKTNQKQSNEYMNAFEKGQKTFKELKENITMKAKRNALVRKIDTKSGNKNNENEAMEASRLFNAGGGVKNLTRGKNERDVNKNVLEKTRKLVGFGIGGKSREKFLARGRGMQDTRPLVKELDERLNLINKVKNLPNRKELEKVIRNSNTTINRVRVAVKTSQNKQNKNIANASKSLVAGAIGNLKKKNAAATKIQAGFRGKKGRNQARRALLNKAPVAETFVPEPKMTNNPLFNAKPSFRALVQKNKEKRVMNAVKLAGKKVELSRASGPDRVKMARNLAPKTQENVNSTVGVPLAL